MMISSKEKKMLEGKLHPELQKMAIDLGNEELYNMYFSSNANFELLSEKLNLRREYDEYSEAIEKALASGDTEIISTLMSEYRWGLLRHICLPSSIQ